MGAAKKAGTFEERRVAAITRRAAVGEPPKRPARSSGLLTAILAGVASATGRPPPIALNPLITCPVCSKQARTLFTCPDCWAEVPRDDQDELRRRYIRNIPLAELSARVIDRLIIKRRLKLANEKAQNA